jgi:hypothetical protein
MADLQELMKAMDELSFDDLERLYQHILERRRPHEGWVVPPENIAKLEKVLQPLHEETAQMTEEEVNAVIDEALVEVRCERFRAG